MTRTQLGSGQIKGVNLSSGSDDITGTLPVGNGGTGATSLSGAGIATVGGAETLTNKTLTSPKLSGSLLDSNGNVLIGQSATAAAVNSLTVQNSASGGGFVGLYAQGTDADIGWNLYAKGVGNINMLDDAGRIGFQVDNQGGTPVNYPYVNNSSTGVAPAFGVWGADTNVDMNLVTKGVGVVKANGAQIVTAGMAVGAADIPNGITNGNTSRQSQVVVSGTSYYVAGSNLNLPATLKTGMAVGTRFRWRVAMDKTAAGTGAFAIEIRRGTAGTTADTADVSQSVGTQTAAVDSMVVDVEMVVTTTGATGAYYWTIIPVQQAATATGFGVATGPTGLFSGTVSSVAMNTASLKFGLSFKATTGTPTITIPLVQASAINIV